MKKVLKVALLGVCLSGLAACDSKAPGCSDSETKELVMEISRQELENQVGKEMAGMVTMKLEGIRTTDVNDKTGACRCAADLVISGPGGSHKLPITYTSELTDKSDEFYVTVFGLE